MLMAWGPFRFTIPTYSVETLRYAVQPRIEEVPVIQAPPSLHKLGPGNATVSLQSTFHPHHLNGRGLAQLRGVKAAVNAMAPYSLCSFAGDVLGPWIAVSLEDEQEMFDAKGTPATVQVTLELKQDGSAARSIAMGLMASISLF